MMPRRPALLAGFDNTVDILVRLQAPAAPPRASERSPLNLAIVLDRSGSMQGRPLDEAKRCAGMIVDRLGTRDRAALVIYDHDVDVLVPTTQMVDKPAFHAAVASVQSRGWTNLHGGWLKGAELMAAVAHANAITQILLLSDGQANKGVTDLDIIAQQCAELAGVGVTTSTYGLGRNFNEDLMVRMANAGQGNSYYGETAEDLMDPFTEEFDLLAALCAKRVHLHLDMHQPVSISVLNKFSQNQHGDHRMSDLAHDGESWAVIRLTVPKTHAGSGDSAPVELGSVAVSYLDLDGNLQKLAPVAISLPSLLPVAFGAVAEDPLVARRVQELEAANIQDSAQHAARNGDWPEVHRLLRMAKENAKDNEWLEKVAGKLERLADDADEAMFSKEVSYSSLKMRRRLAGVDESVNPAAPARAAYLRRKPEQGKAQPPDDDAQTARASYRKLSRVERPGLTRPLQLLLHRGLALDRKPL
jgi:Ca-activated chloride channel family protein